MDYTIQKGDTLGAIAKKYNTDVNTLAKANNIANPNLIQAGAKLAIPSISAEKISTTPISIPPVQPPTKDPNAFVTSLQSQIQPLQQASDIASTNVNTAQQDLITLQKQLEGKTAEQIQLENQQNIPQINTELVGLQSEAQRLTTEYLNAIRNREAQGGVAAVVGADQKRIQSQAASDIGLINAQIQAKQGQLELARGTVDRAIAIKYEPLIQSIETKKLIYEMNKDSLSRADQKLLEAKNKEWNLQLDKYKKEQEDVKSMQDMIIDAQAQGAPSSVISSAQLVIKNGGTPAEVAVAIGKYSGAAAKAELLKQQIKTEKAQQSKYYADTAKVKAETDLYKKPVGAEGVVMTLPKPQQDRYYKLQGDFDTATKNYRGAIDASSSIKALSKDATPQQQTAIIFQYMKTLDPTSTVREGEFALVGKTAGLGDRAINALRKLDSGLRLNENQIKDIVGSTEILANNARKNLEYTSKEYDRRAEKFGLPKGLFYEPQQQVEENNPFAQALGKATSIFTGTSILAPSSNGSLNFIIPKQP